MADGSATDERIAAGARSSVAIFLRVTWPLSGVNFLNQASRTLIATIGPLLALEFSLSATELGLLAAVFFASYAAAQLPVGLAMDLFGVRRLQVVLALIAGLGFAVSALSSGPLGFALGRMITGVGISVGMIAMLTANSQWLPRHKVAAMTGMGIFVSSAGGIFATLPAQQLLPLVGWRGVFGILAALSCIVSAWIWLAVPEQTRATVRRRSLWREMAEYGRIFAHPVFLRFAPAITLLSGLNFTYGGLWAGPWLRDVGGFDDAPRALLLLVYMSGMMTGSLLTGQATFHALRRGFDPMTVPIVAICGIWLTQIMLMLHPTTHPVAIGALWFSFAFLSSAGPSGYAAVAQLFPPELAGRVGTAINGTMLVFVFVLQNVIGWILDLWPRTAMSGWDAKGYGWALGLTTLLQAAATLWMFLPRHRARQLG